jgi:two-component system chemotaxis response regulator CheB
MASLPAEMRQPILITQHMPPTFTTILAEHLTRSSGRPAREGQDGEPIEKGRIYVAPGDYHMVVDARPEGNFIRLNKEAPENFCRPSVDPMYRSIVRAYGKRVLGVILTGMGHDGLKGGQMLVEAGANLIAQDEATSVVWGMPGAVANAGLCSAVLPLAEIGPQIQRLALKGAPR